MLRFCSHTLNLKLFGDTQEYILFKAGDPLCFINTSGYWAVALSSRGVVEVSTLNVHKDSRFYE